MHFFPLAGELNKGEKYILTGIIMTLLLGGFGDLMPLLGLIVMLIGSIILIKNIGWQKFFATPLTLPFLLFFVLALISLFKMIGLRSAGNMVGTLLEITISFFASYYIFSNKSREFHDKMLLIFLTGGGIVAVFGVYEKLFLNSRRLGLIMNSNLLGIYMVFLFLLVLSFLYRGELKYKIAGVILACLFVFNLVFSLSRAAFLGLVSGTGFFFFFKNKKLLIMVILIFIIIFNFFLPVSLQGRFYETYTSLKTGDYEQRIYIWKNAYEMFKENPLLGVGIGQYRKNYKVYPDSPRKKIHNHAHNILIQITAELGLAGLLTFVFMVGLILKMFYRALPFSEDFRGNLALCFSAAFAGFFVQEMFEFSLISSAMAVMISILFGWSIVLLSE